MYGENNGWEKKNDLLGSLKMILYSDLDTDDTAEGE